MVRRDSGCKSEARLDKYTGNRGEMIITSPAAVGSNIVMVLGRTIDGDWTKTQLMMPSSARDVWMYLGAFDEVADLQG